MKISIGTKIKEGPWGGGNLFAINLKEYLQNNGHIVIDHLFDDDIDLILLTEPRKTSESSMFTHMEILKYIQFVKKDVVVVHRVNECDERKNTNYVNKYLIEANKSADATVFVSSWLKKLFLEQGLVCKHTSVILSGANKNIFYKSEKIKDKSNKKLDIVTHHWGNNLNKGFEIYKQLDDLLYLLDYKNKFTFTFIGNLPSKFKFKNTKVIKPLSGRELASQIRKHDIYLTASINEPSGNHHIEGAQCGLPLLYINSGGIPEYCNGFGVMFEEKNFEDKLNELYLNFSIYKEKMIQYPFNSDVMSKEYLDLFEMLIKQKEILSKNRKKQNLVNKYEKYVYLISRKISKYLDRSRNL